MGTTIHDLARFKAEGLKFAMLTAYDFQIAQILDEAGIPVLLVGDSLGMVVLGYDTTVPVTMDEMLHHTRAVARGARNALVVGDMPFMSYQAGRDEALHNAGAFLKAGAHAVKIEGRRADLTAVMSAAGIPVMAHLGLTPQSVNLFGGFKVQGRSEEQRASILTWAKEMEEAGAFAVVLECIPSDLATAITKRLSVPTIGIGAGNGCDAQVLVVNDLLGLGSGYGPRFVKQFANLRTQIADAAIRYKNEVESGAYPDEGHSYS